jgi:hypothetical protein
MGPSAGKRRRRRLSRRRQAFTNYLVGLLVLDRILAHRAVAFFRDRIHIHLHRCIAGDDGSILRLLRRDGGIRPGPAGFLISARTACGQPDQEREACEYLHLPLQ